MLAPVIAVESKRAGTSMKYSFGLRLRRQQLPIIEWMTAPRQLACGDPAKVNFCAQLPFVSGVCAIHTRPVVTSNRAGRIRFRFGSFRKDSKNPQTCSNIGVHLGYKRITAVALKQSK
jgi:hypothetical protein